MKKYAFGIMLLLVVLSCTKTVTETEYIEVFVFDTLNVVRDTVYQDTPVGEYAYRPDASVKIGQSDKWMIRFEIRITKMDTNVVDKVFATGYVYDFIDASDYIPANVLLNYPAEIEHVGPWRYLDTEYFVWYSDTIFCWNDTVCDYNLYDLTWNVSVTG